MANPILILNPPFHGLSSIVNVVSKVGPNEVNSSDDVKVVQRLIQIIGSGGGVVAKIGIPAVTGNFDAATGFWIYHIQFTQRRSHPNQIVDGIVSPARGASYAGNNHWAIVLFSAMAKDTNSTQFAKFLASGGTA